MAEEQNEWTPNEADQELSEIVYADPQEESGGNAARLDALRTRLKSCERAAPCTQHDATRCALITTPSPHLFTPSSPC